MVNVAAERKKSLVAEGYVVFHVKRWHALVEGSHHNRRDFNVWKDVHRHSRKPSYTQNHDHERSDNNGVRIAQRETWHDANSQSPAKCLRRRISNLTTTAREYLFAC